MIYWEIVMTYVGLLLILVGTGRETSDEVYMSDEFYRWMTRVGLVILTTGITWWTLITLGGE